MEQSSLQSQSRGCAKTPIPLTVVGRMQRRAGKLLDKIKRMQHGDIDSIHARVQHETGYLLERVWDIVSREPSDTPPESQLPLQRRTFRVFRLPSRRSRRRLGSPWVGPINATLKHLSEASYGHPSCNLNLVRLFRRHFLPYPPSEPTSSSTNILCCMVITYSKSKDQPGKVANPARGQLNREN